VFNSVKDSTLKNKLEVILKFYFNLYTLTFTKSSLFAKLCTLTFIKLSIIPNLYMIVIQLYSDSY